MEELGSLENKVTIPVYKQDIDDNCPMTGDETDTETSTYLDHVNTTHLSDIETVTQIDHPAMINDEEQGSPRKRKTEMAAGNIGEIFPLMPIQDDEEESLSSDRNYFSDEETSSIAGSFDDFGKDDDDSTSEPVSEKSREEKLRRLALRRHLDQLGDMVIEKECEVQQSRDELQKCREYLEKLNSDHQTVSNEIKEAEEKGQMASFYRLKSKLEKLSTEVEIEKEVEAKSLQNLEDAEFYLAQTYIEHAKFLPLDEELEAEEKQLDKVKGEKASARIKKELDSAMLLERRKKNRDKEYISTVRERERKNRQALISAKKNREVAMKYLKDTMSNVRQRESEEEDKSRNDLNQRMSALLSLKRNIELNKENIKAVQARNQHLQKKEEIKEHQERQRLTAMGENPDEVMTRRKRIRQFERDKEAYERKQREREIEIVNKVTSEEKQMKRRYQQQPQLWPDNRPRRVPRKRSKPRFAPSSGSESMEYGADVEDTGGKISYLSKVSTDDEGEFSPYGATNRDDDRETTEDDDVSKEDIKDGVVHEVDEDEENLAEPEFKALWEQDKGQDKLSANWKSVNHDYSKYEQVMMKQALTKQKQNIVQKQFAAGREFKGAAFYSKPEVVLFKDFDIGKTYKKKVLLTNVSYTQNYCQYIGITDRLKDFIDISFKPPGSMSAGLTCDITVIFKPMINENLDGQIEMMAQTGLFYVPIRCLIKRCEVSVDTEEIDFPNQVVGETRKKTIYLKNNGALSTVYHFIKNTNESSAENCEMRVGKNNTGTLKPFSSVQLDVIFAPIVPKKFEHIFHISFDDINLDRILIKSKGIAIDVPVWVERKIVDLKVCMYNRLYQDAIIISNRATSALRLRFEVPKELRDHLDILPKTAYIQAESQFSAQLKFLPRQTLFVDAKCFLKNNDSLLEVPISIRVADQTQPVTFLVRTTVTSSDFEFNVKEINFGYCTVYETVYQTIQLLNKSVLPQQFGFVKTAEEIDVQPNDGFGIILPNEQLNIDVAFSPSKATDYKFNLTCKSHIGREFTLPCKAVGILPPLKLSESLIKFRATAINDVSTCHLFVINDHISSNEFTHPVPRIGSGDIFPVGPTSFQFLVPDDAPLNISPSIGTVLPGQKLMVHVTFSPKLTKDSVITKAKEIATGEQHEKMSSCLDETIKKSDQSKDVKSKSKNQKAINNSKGNTPLVQSPVKQIVNQVKETITSYNDNHMKKAQIVLQRSYENNFLSYKIPCFIAYGECSNPGGVKHNKHNNLYLEVHCPIVRPSLIAVSENGDSLIDFGKVSMGQRHSQIISIQNISQETIALTSSILDPAGPFELTNALRPIEANAVHSLKFSFTPQDSNEFYEILDIKSLKGTVQIRLKGQGIKPQLLIEPEGNAFDLGDVLVMDTILLPLKVTNTSELSLDFDINLGSLLSSKHSRTQILPGYLEQLKEKADVSFSIGAANKSGLCVFGCKPCHGKLEPKETKELSISFSPDHPSELYRDELLINVNGNEEFLNIHLLGRGWPSIIFAKGWDRLTPAEESLVPLIQTEKDDNDTKSNPKNVLLTFHSVLNESKYSTGERVITAGCIRSTVQIKKSCDFFFENCKEANDNGFTIEPMKGGIDIGTRKSLVFRWTPPACYDPENLIKTSAQLVMRGETTITYKISLRGYVVSPDLPSK